MAAGTGVRIRLLGGLAIDGVDVTRLGSRKARLLVKRLAAERGRPVSVDALVDVLWPDADAPARPTDQISVLASRCRAALGDVVARTDAGYALRLEWLDVAAMEELVDEAATRLADGAPAAARAAADAALTLARGPLLPEDADAPWLDADRALVARLITRALAITAEAALASGRHNDAIEAARRALDHDPYDEASLRLLMHASAGSHRPAIGLAAYAEVAARLRDELGVDPHSSTQQLHLSLLAAAEDDGGIDIADRSDIGGQLPGRDNELVELSEAFARAQQGMATVVSIEGEPGIGKTRLLDAFLSARDASVDLLRVTASASGVLPLAPLLDAIRARLVRAGEEERRTLLGKDIDVLGALLGFDPASRALTYRELVTRQEPGMSAPAVLQLAVLGVMTRIAAQRTVVLAIDDAHNCDPSTLGWISLLIARAEGLPLLVVLTRRDTDIEPISGARVIRLGRMDRSTAALVLGPGVSDERLDDLYARSGGHPLFLLELANAGGGELPTSIRDAVLARVAGTGDAAATLSTAAELGATVDVDLLATVLARPAPELIDQLEVGLRRGVLSDAATGFVFRHEIVREALAADLSVARRAWLHRAAALALNARTQADPLVIAEHARLGGDVSTAAAALRAAAEMAGARFDHAEALKLIDSALDFQDSADGHVTRARCLLFLARYDEARREIELAVRAGAGAAALEVGAYAAYYGRDWAATVAIAREAAARTTDPEVRLRCEFLAAKALHATGSLVAAEERFRAAIAAAPRSPLRPFVAVWLGLLQLHKGAVDEAQASLAETDLAMQAPFPFAGIYIGQITTHAEVMAGRPLRALAHAERLREAVAEQNAARFVGRAEVYRGWILSLLGAPDAEEKLRDARATATEANSPEPLGQGLLDLAGLLLENGDIAGAAALVAEVGALLAAQAVSNAWRIDLRRRYLESRIAVAAGDLDAAREWSADVRTRAAKDGMERYVALADAVDVEARLRRKQTVAEDDLTNLAHRLARVAWPECWRVLGVLAATGGSARLRDVARDQAGEWHRAAGQYAESFARRADAVLG